MVSSPPSGVAATSPMNDATDIVVKQALSYVVAEIQRHKLDSAALREGMTRARARADTDIVHLALLGEFNSGKTTFTNALLGTPLLGTAPIPTTDTLTYIRWADTFACVATLENGSTVSVTEQNVQKYSSDNVRLQRLDIAAPVPLLKAGLVLIDTPGFNVQNERHNRIVESAVSEANACLFLMDARQPGKRTTNRLFSTCSAVDRQVLPSREQSGHI